MLKKAFKTLPVVAALAMLAAFSTAGSALAAQTTSQIIVTSGSDTTQFMDTALGDLYTFAPGCNNLKSSGQPLDGSCQTDGLAPADSVNYFHDTIANRYFIGSGGGINQMCKQGLSNVQNIDIARSSRVPLTAASGGSDCSGLHFVGFAKDAITWEAFPGRPNSHAAPIFNSGTGGTSSLTTAQLTNIFVNCSVTNWNQIGGTAGAINIYVPQANSGTGVTWAAALGVNLASGQALNNCLSPTDPAVGSPGSHISPENTNTLILANDALGSSNPAYSPAYDAIFPFSVGVYQRNIGKIGVKNLDGSETGKINGKVPTFAAIQAGSFPVSRFLFNVYCGAATCGTDSLSPSWVTNFAGEHGFLCNKVQDSGHHNITDPNVRTHPTYRTPTGTGVQPSGEVPTTIKAQGFVPLTVQPDGTYCHTLTT